MRWVRDGPGVLSQNRTSTGFTFYTGLRLRYLLLAGKRLLMQRWLALMLIVLASPAIPFVSVLVRFSQLVAQVFVTHGHAGRHFGALLVMQGLALLWSDSLRNMIRGGPFRIFLDTLPIALPMRIGVTGAVVAVIDLPLALPLSMGVAFTGQASIAASLGYCGKVGLFMGMTVILQAARIEFAWAVMACIFVADYVLAQGCSTQSPAWAILCLALAAGLTILALPVAERLARAGFPARMRAAVLSRRRFDSRTGLTERMMLALPPVLRLQCRCLCEKGSGVYGALMMTSALPFALWALLRGFAYDSRALPVEIVGMGLASQLSLVPFAALERAHARAASFTRTWPLPRGFWWRRDLMLVLGGFVPLGVLFLLPLYLHGRLALSQVLVVLLLYTVLIAALRATLVIDSRWRAMATLSLAALWVGSILKIYMP